MAKWTIKDIYKYKLLNKDNLLFSKAPGAFKSSYNIDGSKIDNYLLLKNMSWYLRDDIFEDEEDLSSVYNTFQSLLDYYLTANQYRFDGLFKTMQLEYNPIENYDRYEESNDERNVEGSENIHIGAQTNTDTNNYGLQENVDTTDYGLRKVTNETGKLTEDINNGVSPEDMSDFVNASHTTTDTIKENDIETEDARQDVLTSNIGSHEDTLTSAIGKRDDDTYHEEKYTNNHTAHLHGNIGTTTVGFMLEEERSKTLNFKFYDILWNEIIKEFCYFNDKGVRLL